MTDRDPETWMWERARAILEQADRLQRRPSPSVPGSGRPSWEPPADVFETPSEVWIVVALPGVEQEQVTLEIREGGLFLSGHRALPPILRHAAVHRLEIPHGRFERYVELPAGTYELGRRESALGCLFLSLRKLS